MIDWNGKKVVCMHNTTRYLYKNYLEFIEDLVGRGVDVTVIAPADAASTLLTERGVRYVDLNLSRIGLNVLSEGWTLFHIYRVLKRLEPDVIFNFSIKPVIYGGLGGGLAGIANIYSVITGMGHLFNDMTPKYKVLRILVSPLYRRALRYNKAVFFQNDHDKATFVRRELVKPEKARTISGSGVDINTFVPGNEETLGNTFILVSRLLANKGIREYVEAARILNKRYADAEFQLLGPYDENPESLSRSEVEAWDKEGVINYLGATDDVRPYIQKAAVFVLPTFYGEGRPKVILQAMAMGKPIITTDAPGCGQSIQHGRNGFVVPKRSIRQLAEAMETFMDNPSLAKEMGALSRKIAVENFDVRQVNRELLSVVEEENSWL